MISFEKHDHKNCISTGVKAVSERCRKAGLRLTPQRRQVLEILLSEHRALGAYDILEILNKQGQPAQPPVAYRALDFLVSHGFAHRVERLNAFVACSHPGKGHTPVFLICRVCDAIAETEANPSDGHLGDIAEKAGFKIERTVIEATGVCPNCQDTE